MLQLQALPYMPHRQHRAAAHRRAGRQGFCTELLRRRGRDAGGSVYHTVRRMRKTM